MHPSLGVPEKEGPLSGLPNLGELGSRETGLKQGLGNMKVEELYLLSW